LPPSLGHQYTILEKQHSRIWVGAWKEAGETSQGLKGQWVGLGVGDRFEIHGFIKNNLVYQ